MRRATALGLVAAVFLIGLAGGMLGARLMQLHSPHRPPEFGSPPFRAYFMQDDLRLTAEQRGLLEGVFERQREKFELLHEELRPRVEGLMEETEAEVEKILTPAQLERFRARRHRWPRGPARFGPPGHEPDPRHDGRGRPLPPDGASGRGD